jgi:hypothetical protein
MVGHYSAKSCLLLGLISIFSVTSASVVQHLNGTSYYSPDATAAVLQSSSPLVLKVTPFTYLGAVNQTSLFTTINQFLSKDDVFSAAFLGTVLVDSNVSASQFKNLPVPVESVQVLDLALDTMSLNGTLLRGPYFLSPDGSITMAYRLYPDPNFAWVESITGPDNNGVYTPVSGSTGDGVNGGVSVAVPSRLYYPPASEEKPLSGLRFGIKDIIDVKGIRTSIGSRAIFSLDRIGNETGVAVQKLVDLGAVLIGKVKTTQYALSEVPTGDYIDQLGPYNPRGDNYQNPQGSSVGSGVSVASYDWLDFTVGTDTGGLVTIANPHIYTAMLIRFRCIDLFDILACKMASLECAPRMHLSLWSAWLPSLRDSIQWDFYPDQPQC